MKKINYNEFFLKWKHCSTSGQKDLLSHLEELLFWNLWYCLNLYIFGFYCQTHQMTVNNLQKMCFKFIWNNKQDKISRKTAIKSIKSGGFGVPDIRKSISALKIMWIRKLKQTKHKWKNIALVTYPFIIGLEQCGPNLYSQKAKSNIFWEHVF